MAGQIQSRNPQSSKKTYNRDVTTNNPPETKQSKNINDILVQLIQMLKNQK